ncbi:MAG TPA: hypothetical protein VGV92_07885 [Gammaproteobacteria bacterium]|nr:hypothetical protein [Gammaproteobacteria bacterium]
MRVTDLLAVFQKKSHLQKGACAISFTREGLTFVQVDRDEQKNPIVKTCDFIQTSFDPMDIMRSLSNLVRKNNCEGFRCHWVLQAKDYSLISIPNLPVSAEELPTALRWHIKDQIDFPITDAAIDYFKVPYLSKTQNEELIYVIVARKNYLEMFSKVIIETKLDLDVIEIPEFSMRNLAELFVEKGQGVGIIEVQVTGGAKLIIMRDGFVYLVRKIEVELHKTHSDEELHVFMTEIQRSCDYYENGLGQTPVSKFLLISPDVSLATQLTEGLGFPVEPMDIASKLNAPGLAPEKLQQCLYAIGGALRQDEVGNEATN